VGSSARRPQRNCSRPGLSASQGREYLQISKKECVRASWRPRRAKQMLYPGRRLRSRNLDSGREREREVVPAEFGCATLARPNPTLQSAPKFTINTKSLSKSRNTLILLQAVVKKEGSVEERGLTWLSASSTHYECSVVLDLPERQLLRLCRGVQGPSKSGGCGG
jgi:hypothetical protein